MTVAVCFSCGEMKFGAFCVCEKCGAYPQTEDDLSLSLALTDHCFDETTLIKLGMQIQRGERVMITDGSHKEIVDGLRQSGIIEQLRAHYASLGMGMAGQGPTATSAPPQAPSATPPVEIELEKPKDASMPLVSAPAESPQRARPAPASAPIPEATKAKKPWWRFW